MVVVTDADVADLGAGPVLIVRGAPDAAERWQALVTRLSTDGNGAVPAPAPAEPSETADAAATPPVEPV
jgi:hypothetical protein